MFRPCIDIHRGVVKQIVGATLRDEETNDGSADGKDPETNFASTKPSTEYANMYKRDRLKGGHIIMLDRSDATKRAALAALKAYPGGMQLGGGVTPDNARAYLEAGASHVIVTSYVFRDGSIDFDRLDSLVKVVGKSRLVLDLSCRRRSASAGAPYFVVTDRWQKFTDVAINGPNLKRLATYCDEFLVHGVDVEGTKTGIDENLVRLLGQLSPIATTYAGGARDLSDMERVDKLGKGRVSLTIGSALDIFGGRLRYDDVVRWHTRRSATS